MAYAEQAYRMDFLPDYQDEFSSSDIRAMRTGGNPDVQSGTSLLVTAAKMAAIVLVVVAALSFARIGLTNAAVTTMIQNDTLSSQIAEARSSGVSLEMEQSVLSSPTAINKAVKRLGMTSPYEVGTLALGTDVVALGADGQLSLSDSIKNVVGIQR